MASIGNSALADDTSPSVGGIIVGTYQRPFTTHAVGPVRDEANAQLELHATVPLASGAWHFEARGGTTPRTQGVSSIDDSNATVCETLGTNGKGRIAITQVYYRHRAGAAHWRLGLLDPTVHLDAGKMAADEYTEFMAAAFVHDPTIGLPSFVLSVGYTRESARRTGYLKTSPQLARSCTVPFA